MTAQQFEIVNPKQSLSALKGRYDSLESIEAKIENLKKQLQKLTYDYYQKAYVILKKIMTLRNVQRERTGKGASSRLYGITSLVKENGITMGRHHIHYIFLQDYFSPTSKKLIADGKLRTATLLTILKRSKKFRKHKVQDFIIQKYLNKEINVNEILLTHERILSGGFNRNSETDKANRVLMLLYDSMNSKLTDIKAVSNMISSKALLDNVINTCERCIKELEAIKKFGKNIK